MSRTLLTSGFQLPVHRWGKVGTGVLEVGGLSRLQKFLADPGKLGLFSGQWFSILGGGGQWFSTTSQQL